MDVQAAVLGLELEVGDGGVKLNLGQALADGLVDLCALLALELGAGQLGLERAVRGGAVVERDGDAAPVVLVLAEGDEELLALGLVAEVHREVEDPLALQLGLDHLVVLRRGHGLEVGAGEGVGGVGKVAGVGRIPVQVVEGVAVQVIVQVVVHALLVQVWHPLRGAHGERGRGGGGADVVVQEVGGAGAGVRVAEGAHRRVHSSVHRDSSSFGGCRADGLKLAPDLGALSFECLCPGEAGDDGAGDTSYDAGLGVIRLLLLVLVVEALGFVGRF